jgi:hypothetical protein
MSTFEDYRNEVADLVVAAWHDTGSTALRDRQMVFTNWREAVTSGATEFPLLTVEFGSFEPSMKAGDAQDAWSNVVTINYIIQRGGLTSKGIDDIFFAKMDDLRTALKANDTLFRENQPRFDPSVMSPVNAYMAEKGYQFVALTANITFIIVEDA